MTQSGPNAKIFRCFQGPARPDMYPASASFSVPPTGGHSTSPARSIWPGAPSLWERVFFETTASFIRHAVADMFPVVRRSRRILSCGIAIEIVVVDRLVIESVFKMTLDWRTDDAASDALAQSLKGPPYDQKWLTN